MFKLYKGITRASKILFLPRMVAVATLIVAGILWLSLKAWGLPVIALIWFIEWTLCKKDDRIFRLLYLAIRTKGLNLLRTLVAHRYFKNKTPTSNKIWQGSTYTPISNIREDQ